jgi:hypothetical protein
MPNSRVETSMRIVRFGNDLWINTRRAQFMGLRTNEDQRERACGRIRYQHGLSAVVLSQNTLMVATKDPIPQITFRDDNWEAVLVDIAEPTRRLLVQEEDGRTLMPDLIERAVLAQIHKQQRRWSISSPRKWYDPELFDEDDGIAAYRCAALGGMYVEGVGIGVAADVQTAFLTSHTLAWFFDPKQVQHERDRRRRLFDRLADRQQGRGTLVYKSAYTMSVYFAKAEYTTCGQVPTRANGKTYTTLLDYYAETYPGLPVTEDTPVVYVLFDGIGAQPVAANLLRLRIMNDNLPRALQNADKIVPSDRRAYIESFWKELGDRPLGRVAPGFEEGFWHPTLERVWRPALPTLQFGKNRQLIPPPSGGYTTPQAYHRRRMEALRDGGCYDLPPTMHRTLFCAYPKSMGQDAPACFMKSLCELLSDCTGKPFNFVLVEYGTIKEATEKLLKLRDEGTALFVLNDEPAAYYNVAKGLDGWRVKRVTQHRLCQNYGNLIDGYLDKRTGRRSLERGQRDWEQFVRMSGLDVLQQMDGIPWRIDSAGKYDAQIVIDVGHDRRYLGFSMLINRSPIQLPSFGLWSDIQHKLDTKTETINAEVLQEELVKFAHGQWPNRSAHPLSSLLFIRDGHLCVGEHEAIEQACQRMMALGLLAKDSQIAIVELHKDTQFPMRLWEVDDRGHADNIVEPTAIEITSAQAVFAGTTRMTLSQGTAEPVLLVKRSEGDSIRDVADSYASTTQLNWSNPVKEQSIAVHVKRADEDLIARSQQEIKRTR